MKFQGGESAVHRLMQAYGFTMKKQLGDHLGAGTGTISTWVKRNYFPGEAIVRCALETGVSLEWLATGVGDIVCEVRMSSAIKIKKFHIIEQKLEDSGFWFVDKSVVDGLITEPACYIKNKDSWIVELSAKKVTNGRWFIDLDGDVDLYTVSRIPGNKIHVSGNNSSFECLVNEIRAVAKVIVTLDYNN